MPVKRVTPSAANALLADGWKYVDVRSVPEYEAGHPAGGYNVPLMHFIPGRGMVPNGKFVDVFAKHFGKDDKVVVGCKTGGRSLRAAEILAAQGWTSVVDMAGGFDGERDGAGRLVTNGWKESGLPVETQTPGRSYAELET